ncbi:glutamine amidotransferase [Lentzea sp. NPDC058436]|uniref:glutamine amidotransferase n=1 Tax=Lentzea sp. NPDC058436 TaxID=3346499 RepID=UPI003646787E
MTSPQKTCVAIRHLAFEDLGLIEPLLREQGYAIRYLDAGVDELDDAADLLIVLGGPIGANDGHRYPVVDQEIALLRRRIAAGLPTLGICLGAQLIARALGATVAPSGTTEIGYGPLTLTRESVLTPLAEVSVLHWHNDRFAIPAGATHLASTAACDNQAFTYGDNVLALQFHLETPPSDVERWLIGHAEALSAAGIDPADIRRDAAELGPALVAAATEVIRGWLHTIRNDQ